MFDVQINSLANADIRMQAVASAADLQDRFMALCVDDADFSRAVSTTTKSLDATRERFAKWYGVVSDVTGSQLETPACLAPSED